MEYITHVGSDGRKLGQPPNKTGSRTQNSVQQSQGTKRKPSQQRTAAVNTAGYKCVDKGESGLVGERSGNHLKLTCNQIYMVRKSELRIKHGTEVTHTSREGYV